MIPVADSNPIDCIGVVLLIEMCKDVMCSKETLEHMQFANGHHENVEEYIECFDLFIMARDEVQKQMLVS